MNSKPDKPEPTPFERFRQMAQKVVAVPKAEVDKREAAWRKEREATAKKKPPEPR